MSNSFQDISKSIVTDFLQTAVIIDDKAFDAFERPKPGITVAPSKGKSKLSDKDTPAKHRSISSHTLDASKLMSSFAKKGLICSVLCPSKSNIEEEVKNTIITAKRSDIVIIDWEIHHKHNGEIALEIIKNILEKDGSSERTRLICIYTGSTDIATTITDLIKNNIFQNDESKFSFNNNELIFKKDSLIISIIAKKEIPLPKYIKHLSIPEEDLPEKIIEIFTKEYSGLMPNITMKALSAIRDNTHKIINRFNNNLDAPYLSHRCLLSPPEEAETHFIPQFKSEIESILEERKVNAALDHGNVKLWIDSNIDINKLRKKMHIKCKNDALLEIEKLLSKGISETKSKRYKKKNVQWGKLLSSIKHEKDKQKISELTKLFTIKANYENLDKELAYIFSTYFKYENQIPNLTMGTLVSYNDNIKENYFLCVQPSCDCVRITTKGRNFLFVPLIVSKDDLIKHIVIKEIDGFVCLSYKLNVYNIEKFHFTPNITKSPILAEKDNTEWFFNSKCGKKFRYVSTLKKEHAQKISNDLAHEISRVGLTQSEWLRRWAK